MKEESNEGWWQKKKNQRNEKAYTHMHIEKNDGRECLLSNGFQIYTGKWIDFARRNSWTSSPQPIERKFQIDKTHSRAISVHTLYSYKLCIIWLQIMCVCVLATLWNGIWNSHQHLLAVDMFVCRCFVVALLLLLMLLLIVVVLPLILPNFYFSKRLPLRHLHTIEWWK